MNYQTERDGLQGIARDRAAELIRGRSIPCEPGDLDYWAWPKAFGSTAGPFGGVGGQAISTFTLEAWTLGYGCPAVTFCRGRVIRVEDRWEGPGR